MARNFCGSVDFSGVSNTSIVDKMALSMNLNNLYQIDSDRNDFFSVATLYSQNFPKPKESAFMSEISDKYLIKSFALLSNYEQLLKKLGFTSGASQMSNDELLLRLYLEFGEQFVTEVYGTWSLVIWDNREQKVFLSKSQHSGASIFYYRRGVKFYFSTLLCGVLQVDQIGNELDEEKLFSEFCRFCEFEDRTIYRDVKFLKPGHSIAFSRKGLSINRYWVLEDIGIRNVKDEGECVEEFLEHYNHAIKSRLSIPMRWGTTLSGGLDSGSTTALFARHAKDRNETVEAFSYVPYFDYFDQFNSQIRLGNEQSHIYDAVNHFENVNLNLIKKDPKGFVNFLTSDFATFGHPPNTTNNWWIEEICKVAKTKNINAIFIAEGGNASVSFAGLPSYRSFGQLMEDTRNGLKLPIERFVGYLLRSIASSARSQLRNTTKARQIRLDSYFESQTLASPDFYHAVNGREIIENQLFDRNQKFTPGKRFQINKIEPGVHCRLGLWNQLGTKYDIVFMDTTRDVQLLEFLVSLPNHMFYKHGSDKHLIRKSFKGYIPDTVLLNKKRAMQMSDIAMVYHSDFKDLSLWVDKTMASDFCQNYIDVRKLDMFRKGIGNLRKQDESFTHRLFLQSTSIFLAFFLQWFNPN
ncbi:MAG: asparagine synthase-related protein [Cytophagales bacterium]|nr:asparagine synthase-related protein [Cytophagales bacterium]